MPAMNVLASEDQQIQVKYPEEFKAINEAIQLAGGQTALAEKLSTPQKKMLQGQVNQWVTRDHRCSPAYVLKVEKVTGVSRHRLRPDLYPEEETA